MRQNMPMSRPPSAPTLARSLPAGAGFLIAGIGSILFWGMIAWIAVIV